jgi:hypothetical protein
MEWLTSHNMADNKRKIVLLYTLIHDSNFDSEEEHILLTALAAADPGIILGARVWLYLRQGAILSALLLKGHGHRFSGNCFYSLQCIINVFPIIRQNAHVMWPVKRWFRFSSDGSFSFHIFFPDVQFFRPEHHWRDLSIWNVHLVHQNC